MAAGEDQRARSELEQALQRQVERAADTGRRQRHHLQQWVRPRGRPQERVFGPLVLAGRADPRGLGSWLSDLDPWDFRQRVLILEQTES